MRSFSIEEQLNSWLFDLDGNVYHPRLRNELHIGITVGIRVLKKEILKKEKEEKLELYKEYDNLNQKYLRFIENKEQEVLIVKKEIYDILSKIKNNLDDLRIKKENQVKILSDLRKKVKNETDKNKKKHFSIEISDVGKKIGILNKQIKRYERDVKLLDGQLKIKVQNNGHVYFSKAYLIDMCNISRELLISIDSSFEHIDQMWEISNKIHKSNKHWKEIIFLKIIKKDSLKLYGEVIDKFRRKNSKCPLKNGDRISFHAKNILFVPSILNKRTKLKPYYLSSNIFEYYVAEKITYRDGIFLNKNALDYIAPGSIVRIQLREKNIKLGQVWYALILEEENDYLYGELLDYNRIYEEKFDDTLKAGCILKFHKESIIEIPIILNKTLGFLSKFKNKGNWGYFITGYRPKGLYHEL